MEASHVSLAWVFENIGLYSRKKNNFNPLLFHE